MGVRSWLIEAQAHAPGTSTRTRHKHMHGGQPASWLSQWDRQTDRPPPSRTPSRVCQRPPPPGEPRAASHVTRVTPSPPTGPPGETHHVSGSPAVSPAITRRPAIGPVRLACGILHAPTPLFCSLLRHRAGLAPGSARPKRRRMAWHGMGHMHHMDPGMHTMLGADHHRGACEARHACPPPRSARSPLPGTLRAAGRTAAAERASAPSESSGRLVWDGTGDGMRYSHRAQHE